MKWGNGSLRSVWLALAAWLAIMCPLPALADAVTSDYRPPAPECPAGSSPRGVGFHGAVACVAGATCEVDADCPSGRCQEVALCVAAGVARDGQSFTRVSGACEGEACAQGARCERARRCVVPPPPAAPGAPARGFHSTIGCGCRAASSARPTSCLLVLAAACALRRMRRRSGPVHRPLGAASALISLAR